jgi:hypothetical protein
MSDGWQIDVCGTCQLIEHAPGPRGSPHVPHAEGAKSAVLPDAVDTANVDNNRVSSVLLHDGQFGSFLP